MTANRMRRRRLRRARAVRHCLDRHHQQVRIEEELNALPLPRSDSLWGLYLPAISLPSLEAGYAGFPAMR